MRFRDLSNEKHDLAAAEHSRIAESLPEGSPERAAHETAAHCHRMACKSAAWAGTADCMSQHARTLGSKTSDYGTSAGVKKAWEQRGKEHVKTLTGIMQKYHKQESKAEAAAKPKATPKGVASTKPKTPANPPGSGSRANPNIAMSPRKVRLEAERSSILSGTSGRRSPTLNLTRRTGPGSTARPNTAMSPRKAKMEAERASYGGGSKAPADWYKRIFEQHSAKGE